MKSENILAATGIIIVLVSIYNFHSRMRKNIPVFVRKNLAKNYNARTIPPFGIYVKESEKDNHELLNHEKVHWKQYQEMGLLKFYSKYKSELRKHGYDEMPMEKEARENESEYCKSNYTECVRNGDSKTIYNPNFRLAWTK